MKTQIKTLLYRFQNAGSATRIEGYSLGFNPDTPFKAALNKSIKLKNLHKTINPNLQSAAKSSSHDSI